MRVNIDQLTEPELIDLNRRIVERLRMLHQMHAHVRMLEFQIGERVRFETDRANVTEGTLVRYNKKSVTVVTDDGGRFRQVYYARPRRLLLRGSPAKS